MEVHRATASTTVGQHIRLTPVKRSPVHKIMGPRCIPEAAPKQNPAGGHKARLRESSCLEGLKSGLR